MLSTIGTQWCSGLEGINYRVIKWKLSTWTSFVSRYLDGREEVSSIAPIVSQQDKQGSAIGKLTLEDYKIVLCGT